MDPCVALRIYATITDPVRGRWTRLYVERTHPAGALVRWLAPDGGVVVEAVAGEAVEILTDALVDCTLSITPPAAEV